MDTLTRTGVTIPKTDGSDSVTAFRLATRSVGSVFDTSGVIWEEGAAAAIPAPGTHGRFYKPLDIPGVIYWDNGSAWETIGGSAATDAAPGVGSLRTLGAGANQAAPGDTTASAVAQVIAAELRDWSKPGAEVPGLLTAVTSVTAGPTTVVAAPASGRRVVKSLTFSTATAGSTATITWASLTLGTVYMAAAGTTTFDVCLPAAVSEPVQVTISAGSFQVTAAYGDRADALVLRLGYASSSSATGTLISAGTARTITQLWIANNSTTTPATTAVAIGGTTSLSTFTVPAKGIVSYDSPVAITAAQAVTFVGDATNALTYLAVGR